MAIQGIVPPPIDNQLQGQVPVPAGMQQAPVNPAQVAPQVPPPVQAPAVAAPPPQAQPQLQPQPEPPGPFGIPMSKMPAFLQNMQNPATRLQAATMLGQSVPAPTDEEFAAVLAQISGGGE